MKTRGVYILKGKRYYVGYTGNLKLRLEDHKKGTTKTTRELGDWEFVKFIECRNKTEAIKLEKNIKRGGHIERGVS
ncbi:MAG TPA: GIY-YIG nuclease family protein [Candidatus Absconditabacterales bacterium]|nr:GIY-YIG nuclease family protein [Candidatus Absconditabacterales bacterium]